jgi:hypothetical protein
MDTLNHKLNKKLDTLIKHTHTHTRIHKHTHTHTHTIHKTEKNTHTSNSRLINLTNVTFTKEQINTLT